MNNCLSASTAGASQSVISFTRVVFRSDMFVIMATPNSFESGTFASFHSLHQAVGKAAHATEKVEHVSTVGKMAELRTIFFPSGRQNEGGGRGSGGDKRGEGWRWVGQRGGEIEGCVQRGCCDVEKKKETQRGAFWEEKGQRGRTVQ